MEDVYKVIDELRAKAQEFFDQAGKEPLEVYRIEKLEPKSVPNDTFGQFYNGDSYVVLKKTKNDDYDIHYWHGQDASMDEETCAAALSVQLSDNLNAPSRHHLELQGEESQLFLSYFRESGVTYLEGGVESGLKQTTKREHEPRLLQVKGKKYPRVWTFTPSADVLNEGDVFILDNKGELYLWPGEESNVTERMRAIAIIQHIKDFDYSSNAKLHYPRDDEEAATAFWEVLGGKPDTIQRTVTDNFDHEENEHLFEHKLFKVSNAEGDLQMDEITERPLKRAHLDTNDVFILELERMIYVWCGKEANYEEKNNAILTAKEFKDKREKSKKTSIVKVPEFGEDALFKSFFVDFYILKGYNIDQKEEATDQIKQLYLNKQMSNVEVNTGPASSMKVYVIVDEKLEEILETEYGHFYEDNVYIIDAKDSSDRRLLYLWVGNKKTLQDLRHCEKYFGEITDHSIGDDSVRVRMRKGKESSKFLALFAKGVVIHEGARGVENTNKQIYCVYSPFNKESKAIELDDLDEVYFNSGNVYYLISPDNTKLYKWVGNGSNDQERTFDPELLFEGKEIIEVTEGEEPEDLWQTFFGQDSRPESMAIFQRKSTDIRVIEPRLFLVSNETGYFHIEEIYDFGQEDLDHGDVMILDAYDTLFIWTGRQSNTFEKKKSMELANFYIDMCIKNGRENKLNIVEVTEGNEGALFKSFFPDWDDDNLMKESDRLKEISTEVFKNVEERKGEEAYYTFHDSEFDGYEHPRDHKYTKEQINEKLDTIKRSRCELYLEDAEFESIFGMSKDDFYQLKEWKRLRMKKDNGLW